MGKIFHKIDTAPLQELKNIQWRKPEPVYHCDVCDRKTNVKKHIGAGTWVMVLLTGGFWLLLIPFYRKRCVFCQSTNYREIYTPPVEPAKI